MAIRFSIDLRAALRNLFPDGYIRQLARTTGATKRLRNVDPVHLFWTLVLGFGVERERTLADLRRPISVPADDPLRRAASMTVLAQGG